MNRILLLLVTVIGFSSCNRYEFEFQGTTEERFFQSVTVQDEYKIFYYLPANYDPNNKYPLIFLLDGNWYFDEFTKTLNDLVQGGSVEPAIVIGLGYAEDVGGRRFRDYTFPADPEYDIANGEADKFSEFLKTELIPELEAEYSTDTSKYVLMGHSLGGLNTLYNMLQTDSPFSGYVAVSSSVWWNDGFLFGMEEQFFNASSDLNAKAFISIGGDEPPSMTILNEEIIERLNGRNYNGFSLKSEFFTGGSHSQVPMLGFEKGIQFVLN